MSKDTEQTSNGVNTQEVEADVIDLPVAVDDDSDGKGIPSVYEVGYHLLKTIPEDALEAEVNKITDVLKKLKANFIGERFPAHVTLAYAIEKKSIDGVRRWFDSAYFGWVAFEAVPSVLPALEEALKAHENILRYLVVKTSRDSVASTMADPGLDIGTPKVEVEESVGEVSEQELDEALGHIEGKDAV